VSGVRPREAEKKTRGPKLKVNHRQPDQKDRRELNGDQLREKKEAATNCKIKKKKFWGGIPSSKLAPWKGENKIKTTAG